jgi:uncharacterized alpha-E superfamily protein
MLSRVADNLYWMSRYLERAESTLRQLDVTMSMMLDSGGAYERERWMRLVAALGKPEGLEWNGDLETMAAKLVFDATNHASVVACVNAARENARQVREEISTETWQRLNRLFHHVHDVQTQRQFAANPSDTLASILDGINLVDGVSETTMLRGQGWQFLQLGRYLERTYATATMLEAFQHKMFKEQGRDAAGGQALELASLLRCNTSFEAFCQVYTADITAGRVWEFLLLNAEFPHTVRFCVDSIRRAIESIPATGGRRAPLSLNSGVGRLHAMLGYSTIEEILRGDTAGFLRAIREQAMRIHELIYRHYVQYSIHSALAN